MNVNEKSEKSDLAALAAEFGMTEAQVWEAVEVVYAGCEDCRERATVLVAEMRKLYATKE